MLSWLGIFTKVASLIKSIVDYFRQQALVNAGRKEQTADNLTEAMTRVEEANKIDSGPIDPDARARWLLGPNNSTKDD